MTDDIVTRLRSEMHYRPDSAVIAAAADLIEAQQAEIERLRAERDAVEALHQRKVIVHRPNDDHDVICNECDKPWPCRTYVLLHPEESRHE